jgi:hypothetical protein
MDSDSSPPRLMTVARAVAELDCHPETIRRAIRRGDLACYRMMGCTHIAPEHLQAYLDASFNPARTLNEPVNATVEQKDMVEMVREIRRDYRMRGLLPRGRKAR